MEENTLAMELLHQIKSTTRKWFIAFIILLVMFFASNLAWLYAWNLPVEDTDTTTTNTYDYDVDREDDGNAVYNESGEVHINGESTNNKDSNN